ncbi:PilZ domain-containing protein [Peteryoungia desertarenae]|uniref:PilZ domain-containing protein n=1 Tax=Peteryoungia desertarenae TaxID=1813451 RepID=UPI001FEA8041|nr:PilZ domain-containing protein [Peteryoungia desertarenae]
MDAAHKLNDARQDQRIRCRIKGILTFLGRTLEIRIIDVSRSGMALELHGWIEAKRGSRVTLKSVEFGCMEATVRWYRAGKMGIEFEHSSNTAAQVSAYFKNFHRTSIQPLRSSR